MSVRFSSVESLCIRALHHCNDIFIITEICAYVGIGTARLAVAAIIVECDELHNLCWT